MKIENLKKKYHYIIWSITTRKLRKNVPKYNILSIEETLELIIKKSKSISRFGDGEFRLFFPEHYLQFQCNSDLLRIRLKEVLNSRLDNHIVALPEPFHSNKNLELKTRYWWKKFANNYGYKLLPFIPNDYKYGNSFFTRFYLGFKNKSDKRILKIVSLFKKIWHQKDILIVEGKYSRLGVGNDLFDNAKDIKRIICPEKNAFEKYDSIFEKVKEFGKDKIILIALGPTATVMAYDLAKENFWAIDIGHIDIEYMWYKMRATEKTPIKGRLVNETNTQETLELDEKEKLNYENSIVYRF